MGPLRLLRVGQIGSTAISLCSPHTATRLSALASLHSLETRHQEPIPSSFPALPLLDTINPKDCDHGHKTPSSWRITMERLEKAKELRATAFGLENDLSNLRSRLGDLEEEAKPLGPSGTEFAKEVHDIISKLDDIAGRISAAGRSLEGRERNHKGEAPTVTSLVVAVDVDLEPPDARAVAAMITSLEYGIEDSDWQGHLAAQAAAWLIRQHPALVAELRALHERSEAREEGSLLFEAEMRP